MTDPNQIASSELADKLANLLTKSDDAFVGQMMRLYGDIFIAALRADSIALERAFVLSRGQIKDDMYVTKQRLDQTHSFLKEYLAVRAIIERDSNAK